MVLQGVSAEGEEEVFTPLGVVGGLEVEDDGHQVADVLHSGSLTVQMSDDLYFGVGRVDIVVPEGLGPNAIAEGPSLQLLGVGQRTLLSERGGSSADALLGGGGGFEEINFLLKLLAAADIISVDGGGFLIQGLGRSESVVTQLGCGGSSVSGGGSHGGHEETRGAARRCAALQGGGRRHASRGEVGGGSRREGVGRSLRGRAPRNSRGRRKRKENRVAQDTIRCLIP